MFHYKPCFKGLITSRPNCCSLKFHTGYTVLAREGHSFYLFGIILDIIGTYDSNITLVYNKSSLKNSRGFSE